MAATPVHPILVGGTQCAQWNETSLCASANLGEPIVICKKPGEKETKSGSLVLDSPSDKIRLFPAEANWTGRYSSDRLGNGQQLGEYEVVGSFDRRTFYKQEDTLTSSEEGTSLGSSVLAFDGSGPKLFGYCLGKCGRWYVGFKVGEIAPLRNTKNAPSPPNSGWRFQDKAIGPKTMVSHCGEEAWTSVVL